MAKMESNPYDVILHQFVLIMSLVKEGKNLRFFSKDHFKNFLNALADLKKEEKTFFVVECFFDDNFYFFKIS